MDVGYASGGSRELAYLIDRYGEILLPELKHYFGLDLGDAVLEEPLFSPRYVLAHIRWLPAESAFVAECRGGPEFRGWDGDRYVSVAILEAIRSLQYVFILANRDPKKRTPNPPDPYPLPDKITRNKPADQPGSFAFIAKAHLAAAKKRKAAV